jgi:hypothetical protein
MWPCFKDLDADVISARVMVVLADPGDVAPGEEGIHQTIAPARGQVVVGESQPTQVVGVAGQTKVGREVASGDRPGVGRTRLKNDAPFR